MQTRAARATRDVERRCGRPCDCHYEQHFQYRWDELNRISEARRLDRHGGVGNAWTFEARQRYRYDGANVRVVKESFDTSAGLNASESRVALYVYPGDFERRGLERNGTTYSPNTDPEAASETQYMVAGSRMVWSAGTAPMAGTDLDVPHRITVPVSDLLHTTSASVDLWSGDLLEVSTYYPNGARETLRVDDNGDAVPLEPMGFTGKEADEDVGLVYFGERYLIARLGRWSSPDPQHVHASGGGQMLNSYHYVSGNSFQARDPLGLDSDVKATHVDEQGRVDAVTITTNLFVVAPSPELRSQLTALVQAASDEWTRTYTTQVDGHDVAVSLRFSVTALDDATVAHNGGYVDGAMSDDAIEHQYSLMGGLLGGNVVYSMANIPREPTEHDAGDPMGERSRVSHGNAINITPGTLSGENGQSPVDVTRHEIGHVLGLADRYDRRTGRPLAGYGHNVMGSLGHGVSLEQAESIARAALRALDQPSSSDPRWSMRVPYGERGPGYGPRWREDRSETAAGRLESLRLRLEQAHDELRSQSR